MRVSVSRRQFLITGAAMSGGLLVGCGKPSASDRLGDKGILAVEGGEVALNGWVKIGPDGKVTVAVPRSEMGQGVLTALPMLLVEELDARWEDVQVEQAPVAQIYANATMMLNVVPFTSDDDSVMARVARASMQRLGYALSLQVTGGSASVRDAWEPMRLAGATARAMLVQAAATRWSITPAQCQVEAGHVINTKTGARLGFGELAKDASALTPPQDVRFKDPSQYKLIGKPMARQDIPAKVNGSAEFGIDVKREGMVYAAIAQPPVFGAKVASVDSQAALQRKGVLKVLQIPQGVVVVANNWWRAKQALAEVKISYEASPNDKVSSADIRQRYKDELAAKDGFTYGTQGDADGAFKQAAKVIEADYWAPFLAHAAMEPINCVAQVKDGQVEVWCSTQSPSLAKWKASQVAGVDSDKVKLHVPFLGGGFGRRLEVDMVEQAVAIAKQLDGKPVKLVWTREEDMQHDMYRPAALSVFRAAVDAKGRVTAWSNRVAAQSVSFDSVRRLMPAAASNAMPDKNQIEGAFDIPYDFDSISVRQIRPETHVPVGSWRSVGHSYNAFFTESFVDELAWAVRQDPYAYRRSLLGKHPRHLAVLDLAASKAGWGKPLPAGRARGIALHESFGSICAEVAEVSVEGGQVKVHRVVCVIDCGTVVNPDTVEAQMQSSIVYGLSAALFGEITIANGRVEQTSFPSYDAVHMAQMPVVEAHVVPSTAAPGGVGEPGTPPIAPAVTNAIYALTKNRIRSLPIRLDHA
ncbi:MAG: xanthine dehydrogenase family protein molybdopterin-binding subunit [Aquabacterium sp.]|uniref:xanthine dehydrogenase family protein molybdopterin-binding subunit n=1 Tax=Aquabacterium sp. TaxID=1872578 RepID=UPI0025C1F068|nr:xanthine dehydrogenase family protein molybdopterin-binding subunit [Aquabacterium sp.]MBI5926507.1 xanthine dehydrogenase family protein molybdopterin-binding subunit [Aquabacterium sp.]